MDKVGFIGLGIMGKPMAGHILKAGFPLTVYNRTKSKADELVAAGATLGATPADVARASDVIITIVSDTPDFEEVAFGPSGIADGISAGKVVIDMSTISPGATRDAAKNFAEMGVQMLDAPVSGGDIGAINATLTIMVGGEASVYERCVPIFNAMGTKLNHMGVSGAGQATKMVNQAAIASVITGVAESLMLASKEGLDLLQVIDVLSGGVANSAQLTMNGTKMAKGDFAPGFFVDLFMKDIDIVQAAQKQNGIPSPLTSAAAALFRACQAQGHGKLGTQSIIKVFEGMANHKV